MVLQNKQTVYQTDVFHYLMGYARAIGNCPHLFTDTYLDLSKEHTSINVDQYNRDRDCAYRIVADHFRTCVVSLFDGVDFDTTCKGHVLRKIFRRMMTHIYIYFNDYMIEQLIIKPIVKGIVSDILNFHLKWKHDHDFIQNKLIKEEIIFIGKLQKCRKKIIKL
jgi:alanyl-tRNA synthetase